MLYRLVIPLHENSLTAASKSALSSKSNTLNWDSPYIIKICLTCHCLLGKSVLRNIKGPCGAEGEEKARFPQGRECAIHNLSSNSFFNVLSINNTENMKHAKMTTRT
jgi:hypothetical protein